MNAPFVQSTPESHMCAFSKSIFGVVFTKSTGWHDLKVAGDALIHIWEEISQDQLSC